MASYFPNGTIFSISTTRGANITVSAISNADPGVATAPAHGLADGNIIILNVASSRLDQRVVRVDDAATGTFDIEGIDTTDTVLFPDGFGVGSAALMSAFVPMSQITDSQSSGGEQQYYQWVYLEDGNQRQRKTFKNARALQLTLDWDPAQAWHNALLSADQKGDVRVLRAQLPNGDVMYWSVEVSFDGEPTFTANQNMQTMAMFALQNPYHTRYAAAP